MEIKLYGYALLVLSILASASTTIAFRYGSNISVLTFLFFASIVGTALSFSIMVLKGKSSNLKTYFTTKNGFLSVVVIGGIVMYVVLSAILSYSTHYVSADLSAVIYRLWPVMLLLISPFIMREKIRKIDILAVGIGFSTLFVTFIGNTAISIPAKYLPIVGLLLVAAFIDAFVTSLQKRYNYDLYSSIFAYNLTSLVIIGIIAFSFNDITFSGITNADVYSILFIGSMLFVASTFLLFKAVRMVKTSIASNAYLAIPFATMLLSAITLKEPIEPYYLVIAIGAVVGIIIQKFAPRESNYRAKSRGKAQNKLPLFDVTSAFINSRNQYISDTITGTGRALAFYTKTNNEIDGNIDAMVGQENGCKDGCIIFTDKKNAGYMNQNELNFIKDITGSTDQHILVIGVGNPDKIEEKLARIGEAAHTK